MAIEIERKYLLLSNDWKDNIENTLSMKQGYLSRDAQSSVRIRVVNDQQAILGVKSTRDGIYRLEYEYEIPLKDALELLQKVAHRPIIEKTRYIVHWGEHRWEIDEFYGDNAGLTVAEVELDAADEVFEHPPWLGKEVSTDARYYNSNLSKIPYSDWKDEV